MKIRKIINKAIACIIVGVLLLAVPAFAEEAQPRNLLNGTYEHSYFVSGNRNGTETISITAEKPLTGAFSAKFSGRTLDNTTFLRACTGIELGKTYNFSMQVYSDVAVWTNVQAIANAGQAQGIVNGPGVLLPGGAWVELTAALRVYEEGGALFISMDGGAGVPVGEAGATLTGLDVGFSSTFQAETFYIDDMKLVEAESGTNLIPDGNFEQSFYVGGEKTGAETAFVSSEMARTGVSSVKFTGRSVSGTTFMDRCGAIELGHTYAYSAWVWSAVPVWTNVQAVAYGTNADTTNAAAIVNGPGVLLPGNEWIELTATFRVYEQEGTIYIAINENEGVPMGTAGATMIGMDFGFSSTPEADTFFIDDVTLFDTTPAQEPPVEEPPVENPPVDPENPDTGDTFISSIALIAAAAACGIAVLTLKKRRMV